MLLECVQKHCAFWRTPFTTRPLENDGCPHFLTWRVDDEITLVPLLIFDHTVQASVFDSLVADFDDDFVVKLFRVLY